MDIQEEKNILRKNCLKIRKKHNLKFISHKIVNNIKNKEIPSIPIIKLILKNFNQLISCNPWNNIVDLSNKNNKNLN